MLEFLSTLTKYLEDLCDANERLLSTLRKYQSLLVSGESSTIEKATPQVDRITSEIRRLDENRRIYVDDFFRSREWDGPRNFTAITSRVMESGVNDEEAAMFERAQKSREKLIELLIEVDAQNSLNITLVGQGLSFAEISLRALLGANDKPVTYGPKGESDEGPSFLDAQA